jgi:trk system potassium uptake protein TrkH
MAAARRERRTDFQVLDLRPVLFLVGGFLIILAALMLLPALVDIAAGSADWPTFLASSLLTLFVGASLTFATWGDGGITLHRRQAFLFTSVVWLAAAAFGALPFSFSGLELSYTDGFFEAMSGITTTGSTTMVGLDQTPPGILLWRALLQWLGGIGFIAIGIAVLPALRIGGMQLFQTESSDRSEKILPRVAQLAGSIMTSYLGLTALCAAAYGLAGMDTFDAITHSMTTLSTGGYANYDASLAFFASPAVEWIAVVFMTAGGLPFVLYVRFLHGNRGALWRDMQVRWYLATLLGASLVVATWVHTAQAIPPGEALRAAAFNVVSVVTTTGYASADYTAWGPFAGVVFFFLLFAGGCTGSTAGGIKQFRYVVLYEEAVVQLRRLMQPSGAFLPRFNGRPISEPVAIAVLAFFFLFALCTVVLTGLLALCGLDFLTSLSGAATVLNNVGPGLGPVIGPAGNFASLPDPAKWLLAFGMLLGRLELFTILVLLVPSFWRG